MALFDESASDTITLAADQLTVETSFNTDPVTTTDSVFASLTIGVTASDALSTTDVVARGYVLWANPQDALNLTDQSLLAASYNRETSDVMAVSDVIHPWMLPDGGELEVDFEGDGELKAVLMKKKPPSQIAVTPPPRVVMLPRPPSVLIEHNVVNPNPPNRGDR